MTATTLPRPHAVTLETERDAAEVAHHLQGDPRQLVRWQLLWVSLVSETWSTLAVVPADTHSLADDVASRLVEAAHSMGQDAVCLSTGLQAPEKHARYVVPLDCPLHAPAAALTARHLDRALLVVAQCADTMEQARSVRDLIGANRFLGCLVVNDSTTTR